MVGCRHEMCSVTWLSELSAGSLPVWKAGSITGAIRRISTLGALAVEPYEITKLLVFPSERSVSLSRVR